MKYLTILVSVLLLAGAVFASDITVNEPRPTITVWKLDIVKFFVFSKTCEVTYRIGYMDGGNFVNVKKERVLLKNSEFNQLINLINNENDIKSSITKAVKTKLGI